MKKHADRPERWRACGRLQGGDGAKGREKEEEEGEQEGEIVGETFTFVGVRKQRERWLQAVNKAYMYTHKLLSAENIRVPLQFLIRSNVNTNSWQCCTTNQELSITSTMKMCFMCLYYWACVCIQRACKSFYKPSLHFA